MTDLLIPNAPKLWTPEGRKLRTLIDDVQMQRAKMEPPVKPLRDAKGNVVVIRPLNLIEEIEYFLREERLKAFAKSLNLPAPIMGGAAGSWTFTNGGRTSLLNGTFDIDSDTFKMALFLSTSNIGAASTTYAGVTNEHANGNGYTTGGASITLTLAGTTTVTVDISTDPTWTMSGGSLVARYAAICEVAGNVLCYCLLDSTPADVTVTTGNSLTVAANPSGVFTLA